MPRMQGVYVTFLKKSDLSAQLKYKLLSVLFGGKEI